MGLAGRKHYLPAPTESLVDESTVGEAEGSGGIEEEAATDLSQRTDRTHHTIPEDGSPITISTNKTTSKSTKLTQGNQASQTSLLIEYFEAGKDSSPNRRPSVRVKVIPSSKSNSKSAADGHIVLTEAREGGTGRKSTTRRISLNSSDPQAVSVDSDISLLESRETIRQGRSAPLNIEIQQGSDLSEMSGSPEARYIPAPSDISSMPADSMLGLQQSTVFAPRSTHYVEESNVSSIPADESVISASEVYEPQSLKPPSRPKERSTSNERITAKVIEKLSTRPRGEVKPAYNQTSKGSSRSASRDITITANERASQKTKNFRETDSTLSPTEVSGFSHSAVSLGNKSDISVRSAASNNINNPKLLQTVEDAIRRLILPELKELKKENSQLKKDTARRSISGEKPRRRRSSKDHAERSGSGRRRSSQREYEYDSLSDSSSLRDASISSISADDPKRHGRSRPAATGLTTAALEARESEESMHRRRRKKRSKSRSSQSASVAESEETFQKHKVPPMPMRSEIDSELTRSSLLSSNTATSQTPTQHEVREVARGSPARLLSPITTDPPRHSADLRQLLGTHHGNFSEHNLSSQRLPYERDLGSQSPESDRYHSLSADDLVLEDPERMRQYERNLHTQHPIRRGLSPIQSVASYQTTEANRHSMFRKSADSMASTKRRQQQLKEEVSISSLVTPSPSIRRARPQGISLENRSEILHQTGEDITNIHRSPEYQSIGVHDRFNEDDHDYNRDSYANSEQSVDNKRISQLTDASLDSQYVDKVTAGQNVVPVLGARPEIVPAPFGVESAVASLIEPSVLSMRDSRSSRKGSFVHEEVSPQSLPREMGAARMTSPLRDHMSIGSDGSQGQTRHARQVDLSPPQSPAQSYESIHQDDYVRENQRLSSLHSVSPAPMKADFKGSPESEIVTNPSVIQGPIGGRHAGHDSWLPGTLTPPMPSQGGMSRDFSSGAIDLIPQGLNVSQRNTYDAKPKTYTIGQAAPAQTQAPAAIKDEGYATGEGDHFPSPAPLAKIGPTGMVSYDLDDDFDERLDDPFTNKKNQYVSGLSQGLSPLYEPATGKGLDRIQSRDIVHLMEHLTVRDAQRNARDTEILVTLVRSAAEMRNSFEDMKNFIADQDAMILDTADKQHEHTQKVIGGPRSMPVAARTVTTPQEDLPAKRRNVFKRALQGLGSKNTAELHNIESMLMQLLDEVEALRSQQASQAPMSQARTNSMDSDDAGRPGTDTGYEPEGRAGTASSGGDRSLMLSNNSSRQNQFSAARRVPENRVSTVMEGDEEFDEYMHTRHVPDSQRTPRASSPSNHYVQRGQSEPLHTPPRMHEEEETTPTTFTSSDKKHKTFSSFLPKQFVSRWSKTTESTEPEFRRSTQSKTRPDSQVSRSGSNIHEYEYDHNPDDRLRSATSLPNDDYYHNQENRPPSPLVPSALSDNPKYQAHRNSQNLQHPQPRQGPTGRNQFRLENAAQSYHNDESMSPVSQVSSNRWAVDPNAPQSQQMHIPRSLSPISDNSSFQERPGSVSSITRRNNGPPRPPKINESEISEPLFPQRPSKTHGTMSPSTYVDDVRAARAGSPVFDKSPIVALRSPNNGNVGRKPSGPRPLSASSNKETRRARFKESPTQSIGDSY